MNSADLIILNANVLPVDKARPRAEALAISGNRIRRIGARSDVEALKAKHTRIVDAAGKTVMPGIVEGHVHLFIGAVENETLMLNGIQGFAAISAAVAAYRAKNPDQPVVVATAVAHGSFGEGTPITRELLDRIVSDRPFIAVCFDHHTVWANTKALEAAGLMRGRELPTGNEIVMGADGLATGELREQRLRRHERR